MKSADQFYQMLNGELKEKFVVIDFYMQYCKWCYFIMEDFNRIIDDFTGWYGADQVAFLKVDGQIIWELAQRYQVMYFPAFIAIAPKSAEAKSVFKNPQRNYETLKMWLSEVIGD